MFLYADNHVHAEELADPCHGKGMHNGCPSKYLSGADLNVGLHCQL